MSCVIEGDLTEEQLLAMFLDAAAKDNAYGDEWVSEWSKIERIALKVCPAWADHELQAELREAAQNRHTVTHSDAFREAYNPHYRIVPANVVK